VHLTSKRRVGRLLGATALGGVLAALAAMPAMGQEAAPPEDEATSSRDVVVVTANRREQDVTEIPYNITALSSDAVDRTGVSSIEDLSGQIPNLVVTSGGGAQFMGAQRQIMRGLNASNSNRNGVAIEQNPVSTYLGNAPYANYFEVNDVERVEVLRGPQGTLYGAGALGGAIRLIPTQPELGFYGGEVSASVGMLDHSDDTDYGAKAILNVPIGDTLALRISGGYEQSAGFIDQYGIWLRQGDSVLGDPILVDPSSPLTSPAQSYDAKDVNSSETTNWRAALRWNPTDEFDATLSHNSMRSDGFGPTLDTPAYNGGADLLLPSVIYPDTGEYEVVMRGRQPYERDSDMTTLDMSYDLGFATVSSTVSHFKTTGQAYYDGTWGTLALPDAYLHYYTGTPANPRFQSIQRFDDNVEATTAEIRLVSNGEGPFDYIVGAFYTEEDNETVWNGFAPGQTAYNSLPGVVVTGGALPGPYSRIWRVGGANSFTDKAIFGELTWHVTPQIDLTGGVRVFEQSLDRNAFAFLPVFGFDESGTNSSDFSDSKFKFNATWEYVDDQRAYFTFSQGFRRGGANAFALTGFLREPEAILDYKPDSVDNYELGLKGRLFDSWTYTADVFIGKWQDPQIGGFTAVNFWPAVFNGQEAESKGFEFEVSGDLSDEFSFTAGYAYTDAKLTESFCVPSGDGSGSPTGDIPCAINGAAGTPLPSAPEHSGTFSLNYEQPIGPDDTLIATLNANYKGESFQNLPTLGQRYFTIPDYWLVNLYVGWEHGPFTTSLYVRNVLDERIVYSENARITRFAPIDLYNTVGRPRSLGVEVNYKF